MSAGDLVVVLAAFILILGFAGLTIVLQRVLYTLRDLRREVSDLREETRPLIAELRESADEARTAADEARQDLERFDKVLGSAEAIGDAVGSRVTKTAFSSPAIKAAGFAKGTNRAWRRLRGTPVQRTWTEDVTIIDAGSHDELTTGRRRRRA